MGRRGQQDFIARKWHPMVKIWIYFSHVIWNRTACKLLAWPPVQALNRSLHHFKTCITWKKQWCSSFRTHTDQATLEQCFPHQTKAPWHPLRTHSPKHPDSPCHSHHEHTFIYPPRPSSRDGRPQTEIERPIFRPFQWWDGELCPDIGSPTNCTSMEPGDVDSKSANAARTTTWPTLYHMPQTHVWVCLMRDTIYYLIIVIYYFWYFYVKNVILCLGYLFPCF